MASIRRDPVGARVATGYTGLAPCPKCGLPLDRHRDPNEERASGLSVTQAMRIDVRAGVEE